MHPNLDLPDPSGSVPMEYSFTYAGKTVTYTMTICMCGAHAEMGLPVPIADEALNTILLNIATEGWTGATDPQDPLMLTVMDGVTVGISVKLAKESARATWDRCYFPADPEGPGSMAIFGGGS